MSLVLAQIQIYQLILILNPICRFRTVVLLHQFSKRLLIHLKEMEEKRLKDKSLNYQKYQQRRGKERNGKNKSKVETKCYLRRINQK